MRRLASEILQDLEDRVSELEMLSSRGRKKFLPPGMEHDLFGYKSKEEEEALNKWRRKSDKSHHNEIWNQKPKNIWSKKSAWSGYAGTVWENDVLEKRLIRAIYKKYNERVPFNNGYEVIEKSQYSSDQFDHTLHYVTFNDYHFIVKNNKGRFGISYISANPFTAQHKWNEMTTPS